MKKIYLLSLVFCLLLTNTFGQTKSKNLVSNGFELTMDSKSCCENAKILHLVPKLFDDGYKINYATINGFYFQNIYLTFFENKLFNIDYISFNKNEFDILSEKIFNKYKLDKAEKDSISEKNTISYCWNFNNQRIILLFNDTDNRYDLIYYDKYLKEKYFLKQKDNL